ncbi:MAG: nucleoside deaminase [Deltaproteobacteria bacterium]|nr:nucleoside deaminase [Deltaproteobacteria bacterium]
MEQALVEARKGLERDEVPIGAVVAGPDGEIIARAHNRPITLKDPTAHAEILALRSAGKFFSNYRLTGSTLYNPAEDNRLNHNMEVISGIMEKECGKLLQDFFRLRRGNS